MKRHIAITIILFLLFAGINLNAQVTVGVQIGLAPPELPVYVQPPCPVDGYLWTPGYWAYGPDGYYWVPGVWVAPPDPGFLWTPGYWGFDGGYYLWHRGYWGPHIGFYGGVHYGYGYDGVGFYGGRWDGGHFRYNTAISSVNGNVIHNTYTDRTVVHEYSGSRASFNGGAGIAARPNADEEAAIKEVHAQPTSAQQSYEHTASTNRNQLAKVNGGRPGTTAMSSVHGRSFSSSGHQIYAAHPAGVNTAHPAGNPQARPANQNMARPAARPAQARPAQPAPRPMQARPAQAPRPAPRPQAAPRPAPRPQAAPRPMAHPEGGGEHGGGGERR